MKLRRVVVNVDQGRRLVVNPEGGLDLEAFVKGIGWVLDNEAHVDNGDLAACLYQAAELLQGNAECAEKCPF